MTVASAIYYQQADANGLSGSAATRTLKAPDRPIAALPALPDQIAAEAEQETAALPRDTARGLNAAIPFLKGLVDAAPAYRFRGTADDRARALECLASAMLYEAGNDAVGQQAVAQVVLNRARHPAFPATICGVVYQGSERRTGCQFSFTCDGSLARRYSEDQWTAARGRAAKAIDGAVFAKVGTATHYHTDWVHPYWSESLTKLAAVDTHLFFRWPGFWGTRGALRSGSSGSEPLIAKLAFRSAHAAAEGAALVGANTIGTDGSVIAGAIGAVKPEALGLSNEQLGGNRVNMSPSRAGSYFVTLKKGQAASNMQTLALRLCGNQRECHVMAWADGGIVPSDYPLNPASRTKMTLEYRRNRGTGEEAIRFDCRLFKRPDPDQCL
ncbi:MAG: cell wall hydrolase [Parasphingorhabdus sp.]|nr:cell wall hydrolase [Parasphingorhabdus sp.]